LSLPARQYFPGRPDTLRAFLIAFPLLWASASAKATESELRQRHIEVLAASCAACHGTNGNSVGGTPVLAGPDPEYFIKQMHAFRAGTRASTVMHHHATGLTPEEIAELADYFARQPRVQAPKPAK